jgi:hypothetical protein
MVALAAVAVMIAAPAARANGDPASDYLLARDVFYSFSEGFKLTTGGKRLGQVVASANQAGYRIRVAVIATPTDLGAVGGLYGQPQRYSEFLGQEVAFVYRDRLLVVMPAGFGLSRAGKPLTAEQPALAGIRIGAGVSGLDDAAADAVVKLAGASGVGISVSASGGSTWYSSAWFLAVVAACTAVVIGGGFLFGRRWLARVAAE